MKPTVLPSSLAMCAAILVVATSCQPAKNTFAPSTGKSSTPVKSAPAAATSTAAATSAIPAPVLPPAAPAPAADGSITTASGLRYKILASGPAEGRSPMANDTVTVHYRGTLTDGTVFDSSYDRGMPTSFGVSQVIPGWTEALQLMKPGDKWMLYIPSRLAYGGQAVGGKIPPYSDLVFQVELLQVGGGL